MDMTTGPHRKLDGRKSPAGHYRNPDSLVIAHRAAESKEHDHADHNDRLARHR